MSNRLLNLLLFNRPEQRLYIVLLSLLAAICGIIGPLFQKTFIDMLTGYPVELAWMEKYPPWAHLLAAFALILLFQFCNVVATYLANREAVIIQKKYSDLLYAKMLAIRTDQLQTRPTGEVVALFATDVPGATILLDQSLPMAFSIFFPLALAPIFLNTFYQIPFPVTLSIIATVALINGVLARRQSFFFYNFKQLAAERVGFINEWVQNIRALRILSWVQKFEDKIQAKRQQETLNRVRMVTNGQLMNSMASSVTFVVNIAGLWALLWVTPGPHSPGQILALFWILAIFLTRSFRQMPWFFTFILDGMSSLNRLQVFLDQTDDRQDSRGLKRLNSVQTPSLHIDKLNLVVDENHLLSNISLDVRSGEFVAIVGEVGAGKTLLLLSLLGETGFTAEKYSFGDQSALALEKDELKSQFAFVSQEGFIMSASIRQNVAFDYRVDESLDQRILNCLRVSQMDLSKEGFIEGLDTEVGERGVTLSGGQKQRVTLARSDFFDRPILLLDDCLSALDVNTEHQLIQSLLQGRWKDRTRILVTHRLTILPYTDRVIFMKDGTIIDQGPFNELFRRNQEFVEFAHSLNQGVQ